MDHNKDILIIDNFIEKKELPASKSGDIEFILRLMEEIDKRKKYVNPLDLTKLLDPELMDDEEIMLWFVKHQGYLLRLASDRLKDDYAIVKAAMKENVFALSYASERIRSDKDIARKAMHENYNAYECLSDTLKCDKEFLDRALEKSVFCYRYTPLSIREDRDLLIKLVKEKPEILQFALEKYRDDDEIFEIALRAATFTRDYSFVKYLSTRFTEDINVARRLIPMCPKVIDCFSDDIKNNSEFFARFGHGYPVILRHAGPKVRNNLELARSLAQADGYVITWSDKTKDDEKVVREATRKWPHGISYASDRIKRNKYIALSCLRNGASLYTFKDIPEINDDFTCVLTAVMASSSNYVYASERLRNNPFITFMALNEYFPYDTYDFIPGWGDIGHYDNIFDSVGSNLKSNPYFTAIIAHEYFKIQPNSEHKENYDEANGQTIFGVIGADIRLKYDTVTVSFDTMKYVNRLTPSDGIEALEKIAIELNII